MKIKNITKEKLKIRGKESNPGFIWHTVQPNGEVNIPDNDNIPNGFIIVNEPIITKKIEIEIPEPIKENSTSKSVEALKGEEEQVTLDDLDGYKKELLKIKGVGKQTVEDIIKIYPNRKSLLKALNEGKDIPIRNDAAKNLKKNFK